MSFLVILRPARDGIEEEREMLEAHWRYLRQMHNEGKLLVAGPSWVGDDPFGIGVFDLRERAEVEAMLVEDPAITSGAMLAENPPDANRHQVGDVRSPILRFDQGRELAIDDRS
jgi:uncharacterized protein YciI